MASLLWGGDAGAAESERLNGHVTATEPGRASGWELEQHSLREMCWGGEGGAPVAFGVGCQVRCGKDLEAGHRKGDSERNKTLGWKGQNEDTCAGRERSWWPQVDPRLFYSPNLTTRPRLAFIFVLTTNTLSCPLCLSCDPQEPSHLDQRLKRGISHAGAGF